MKKEKPKDQEEMMPMIWWRPSMERTGMPCSVITCKLLLLLLFSCFWGLQVTAKVEGSEGERERAAERDGWCIVICGKHRARAAAECVRRERGGYQRHQLTLSEGEDTKASYPGDTITLPSSPTTPLALSLHHIGANQWCLQDVVPLTGGHFTKFGLFYVFVFRRIDKLSTY